MPESEDARTAAEEKEQELETVRSPNFFKVYANSVQIEACVWDLRLIFGELTRPGGKLLVEQSVAVTMSPQHAKALSTVLATNLQEYERKFGQINLPPRKEEPVAESVKKV
jgi:hypothetical protein